MDEHPATTACRQGVISPFKSRGNKSYPRMEIDAFCQDERRLNLYLLALIELQDNKDLADIWSYFRISAIHGRPPMEYNGCNADATYQFLRDENRKDEFSGAEGDKVTGYKGSGFCVHGSVLFPSWHRAYSLVMEQALQAKMLEIAAQFPDAERQEYVKVADKFRQPYWDMFQPRKWDQSSNTAHIGISWIFCVKQVRVKSPNPPEGWNTWKTVTNPLYQYTWPKEADIKSKLGDKVDIKDLGFLKAPGLGYGAPNTCRNGSKPVVPDVDAPSDNAGMQRTLLLISNPNNALVPEPTQIYNPGASNIRTFRSAGMRAKLYACLTQTLDPDPGLAYCRFATRSYDKARSVIDNSKRTGEAAEPRSLESFHDDMHLNIGGQDPKWGTMRPSSLASYDPIFYPFHAGLDMHYSLFLAAHPTLRFKKANQMYVTEATFTQTRGAQDTPTTPLTPFRKAGENEYYKYWYFGERRTTPKYLNTEDLYSEADWNFWYQPVGPTPTEAAANTYINKHYSWLNPVAADSTSTSVPNELRGVMPYWIKNMQGVGAFVPNPSPLATWPPLIDNNTAIVQLHPPAAVTTAAVASVSPPAAILPAASPAKTSRQVKRAVVSKRSSAGTSVSPTAFSVIPRSQVPNGAASVGKPEEARSVEDSELVNNKAAGFMEGGKRTTPSFVHDPPHPGHLYYNLPNHIVKNGREMQNWSFQMRYERFALNSGFTVYVFVGDFPADSQHWRDWGNLALAAHNFANPDPSRMNSEYKGQGDNPNRDSSPSSSNGTAKPACANCAEQAKTQALVGDWVPLTPILLDYVLTGRKASVLVPDAEATLASLEQADVIPFLKRHLHWRILREDGVEIHRSDVAQFVAWVHDEVMLLPRTWDEMPTYEDHAIQWDITHGRPGGLDHGDWP